MDILDLEGIRYHGSMAMRTSLGSVVHSDLSEEDDGTVEGEDVPLPAVPLDLHDHLPRGQQDIFERPRPWTEIAAAKQAATIQVFRTTARSAARAARGKESALTHIAVTYSRGEQLLRNMTPQWWYTRRDAVLLDILQELGLEHFPTLGKALSARQMRLAGRKKIWTTEELLSLDQRELAEGIRVEGEHTDDPREAQQIAADHLAEFSDYYTRILVMEGDAKSDQIRAKE